MTKLNFSCIALIACTWFICGSGHASAGTLTVTQRQSSGGNVLFAGSGGGVDQRDESDSIASLFGSFSFSDSGSVAVDESEPFSTGTADASGSITVSDNVVQNAPWSLDLFATRSAAATANSISGPSNANSTQNQTFRVRFTTGSDPVNYHLTGEFDPGATTGILGEAGRISLNRPFTANTPILITTANNNINEVGVIPANQTWEFLVRMNDKTAASAGNPSALDASSLNVRMTFTSTVPEPSSALILAGAGVLVLLGRRRK